MMDPFVEIIYGCMGIVFLFYGVNTWKWTKEDYKRYGMENWLLYFGMSTFGLVFVVSGLFMFWMIIHY